MSIEQTSQLISLILNSVLMTLLSAIMLGGAWLRQNGLCLQLQQIQKQYRRLSHQKTAEVNSPLRFAMEETGLVPSKDQLKRSLRQVRERRARLAGQYRWSYTGMLLLHAVLLVFGTSLLALALRSFLPIDGLISTALFLFALGVTGLIAGASCILVDLSQGDRNNDPLSYSLAKILAQTAQQLSKQWKKGQGRLAKQPIVSRVTTKATSDK